MFVSAGLDFSNDVRYFLYDNLASPSTVRQMVLDGQLHAAAIEAASVYSFYHLQVAVSKALHNCSIESMRTKNVFSEIIYCLNTSRNISESLRRCGISSSTQRLILVFMDPTDEDLAQLNAIEGVVADISELDLSLDEAKRDHIRSLYKISSAEESAMGLENAIITHIATKDYN